MITDVLPKVYNVPISLALLSIPNYQAYFNFDPNSTTVTNSICGVSIYIHNKISGSTTFTFTSDFEEHL